MDSVGQFLISKIKFWAFIVLIILLYITNRLNTERILSYSIKESYKLEDAILEYKLYKTKLMKTISKSEMLKKAQKYGLIEANKPPITIVIKQ